MSVSPSVLRSSILDPGTLFAVPPPPRDWLVKDLFPGGSTILIGAHPGKGKSYFAMDLALAVASGQFFLGRPTDPEGGPQTILYVDQENDLHTVRERAYKLFTGRELALEDVDDYFHYLHIGLRDCNTPGDVALKLGPLVRELQPNLLILDTWLSVMPLADENDNAESARALAALRLIQAGNPSYMTTIILAHLRKGGDVRDIRGAGHLKGATDATYFLARTGGRAGADGYYATDLFADKVRAADAAKRIRMRPYRVGPGERLGVVTIRPNETEEMESPADSSD